MILETSCSTLCPYHPIRAAQRITEDPELGSDKGEDDKQKGNEAERGNR